MKKTFSGLFRFLPAIFWMCFIFFLSSRSTAGIGYSSIDRFLILKSFHLIEYAILAMLVYFAIRKTNTSVYISYLYAVTDEIHQSFVPGRTPKFSDTLIDLLGIFIGLAILFLVKKRKDLLH